MNWVDIVVLVVWGLMALWGFKSGLIGMIVPLVVITLGLALSSRIAEPVGNLSRFCPRMKTYRRLSPSSRYSSP